MAHVGRLMVFACGVLRFRGLPGDIRYQSDHRKVYFPIVT
jgi:hypothetical protein